MALAAIVHGKQPKSLCCNHFCEVTASVTSGTGAIEYEIVK
jgi:hypothetical protein